MDTSEWKQLLRKLRKHFPIAAKVTVVRCKRKKNDGLTKCDGYSYHIYINSDQSESGQVDSLLHEWAHVRAIEQIWDHGSLWGQIHAVIYNAWEQDFDSKSMLLENRIHMQ